MENKHEEHEEDDFRVTKMSNQHFWTEMMANISDSNHPFNSRRKEIIYLVSREVSE